MNTLYRNNQKLLCCWKNKQTSPRFELEIKIMDFSHRKNSVSKELKFEGKLRRFPDYIAKLDKLYSFEGLKFVKSRRLLPPLSRECLDNLD